MKESTTQHQPDFRIPSRGYALAWEVYSRGAMSRRKKAASSRYFPALFALNARLGPIGAACLFAFSACHERGSVAERSLHFDSSCQHDWECVPAPECCPVPCNEDVINRRDEQRARDALDCSSSEQCPQAGGCRTFAYLCIAQRCKLSFEGDPEFHQRAPMP